MEFITFFFLFLYYSFLFLVLPLLIYMKYYLFFNFYLVVCLCGDVIFFFPEFYSFMSVCTFGRLIEMSKCK